MKIEELLPKKIKSPSNEYQDGINQGILECDINIKNADKDGKICLNPPSEEEIFSIIVYMESHNFTQKDIAKKISDRLRR